MCRQVQIRYHFSVHNGDIRFWGKTTLQTGVQSACVDSQSNFVYNKSLGFLHLPFSTNPKSHYFGVTPTKMLLVVQTSVNSWPKFVMAQLHLSVAEFLNKHSPDSLIWTRLCQIYGGAGDTRSLLMAPRALFTTRNSGKQHHCQQSRTVSARISPRVTSRERIWIRFLLCGCREPHYTRLSQRIEAWNFRKL